MAEILETRVNGCSDCDGDCVRTSEKPYWHCRQCDCRSDPFGQA